MGLKKFIIVSLLLLATRGLGTIPAPKVGLLHTHGEACPQGSARGSLGAGLAYGVTFTGEHTEAVASGEGEFVDKSCFLEVTVTPARGYQMSIAKFILNGWHMSYGNSTSGVNARYGLYDSQGEPVGNDVGVFVEPRRRPDQDSVEKAVGFGKNEGPWEVSWRMDEPTWSKCGEPVTLKGELNLSANRNQSPQNAEIVLHNANSQFRSHMVWAWAFRPCREEPSGYSLDGTWRSHYIAFNGKTIAAELKVNEDRGTYQTSSFTGQLFNIHYQGSKAIGQWQVGSSTGWFSFRFNGPYAFEGEWGVGSLSSSAKGRWWGER